MSQKSLKDSTIDFNVLDEIIIKGKKYLVVGKDESSKHPCAGYRYFNYILEDIELKSTLYLTCNELEDMVKASA